MWGTSLGTAGGCDGGVSEWFSEEALQAEWFGRGWTDGLPVVVPTPARVHRALATVPVTAGHVLGRVVERGRSLTVETVAINAVMAGCLPEYFPVVLAAVEAMCDPAFGVHGVTISTQGPQCWSSSTDRWPDSSA